MPKNMRLLDFKPTPTEFEIQATAYRVLAEHYPVVRGELKVKHPGQRGCRYDLLIFNDEGELLFTVEVKDNPRVVAHAKKDYYEKCSGVPNLLIAGMDQACNAVEVINKQLNKG